MYRDVENPSTPPDNKTTQAAYLNTAEIRHIDFASQVPFEHFTVEVGLFSQGVRGSLVMAEGEYGTQTHACTHTRTQMHVHTHTHTHLCCHDPL